MYVILMVHDNASYMSHLWHIPSADPEGGVRSPLENHKIYGFLYGISNWTPPLPPEKRWTRPPPLEYAGQHSRTLKNDRDFFEIDHLTSVKVS